MKQTALITGGNRGIGQQVARVLAVDGWDVLIAGRDRAKAESAAARLRSDTGGRLKGVELDVTSDASVATAVQKLRDGAIRIDALVNNAGVFGRQTPELTIQTNLMGPLRVTLGMLPLLRDGATITNVTSGLGELANLDAAHRALLSDPALTREALIDAVRRMLRDHEDWGTDAYGVSKAALNALTRIIARDTVSRAPWAVELADRNIRINATCPGWVRTEMGGRNAPRSVEEGAASVLFGVTTSETGGVFRDGRRIEP
ncbi:MAG: SDR family NAD(P)-dependent oxidoreductase [Deltaproteobacteria bacterium]|nr:SDR family NAD(P)-dependent oxidoreductase [Deltaproteobacteria bacterium]